MVKERLRHPSNRLIPMPIYSPTHPPPLRFRIKHCSTIRTRYGLHTINFSSTRSESKIWMPCMQISAWFPFTSLQIHSSSAVISLSNALASKTSLSSSKSCSSSNTATPYRPVPLPIPLSATCTPATCTWFRGKTAARTRDPARRAAPARCRAWLGTSSPRRWAGEARARLGRARERCWEGRIRTRRAAKRPNRRRANRFARRSTESESEERAYADKKLPQLD